MSKYGFLAFILAFTHVGAIVMAMGAAVFIHLQFVRKDLTWGKLKNFFHFGSRVIWIGLGLAIITGIWIWARIPGPRPGLFYLKLAFVAILIIDGILINWVMRPKLEQLPDETRMQALPRSLKIRMFISGAFSVISWWGALFIAIWL
jgi:hypothetical protein